MLKKFYTSKHKSRSAPTKRTLRLESLEERVMFAVFNVLHERDGLVGSPNYAGSLREAITLANATTTYDGVFFGSSFPTGSTIQLVAPLPAFTQQVSFTAVGHPSYVAGTPLLTLDGSNLTSGSGIVYNFSGISNFALNVEGIAIRNFPDHGIHIISAPADSWITIERTVIDSNGKDGVHIEMPSNVAVDSYSIQNSVITNNRNGIYIDDVDGIDGFINNTLVGVDAAGNVKGNRGHGILFVQSNGDALVQNSTIVGNGEDGVRLEDSLISSLGAGLKGIQQSKIGVNASTTSAVPNRGNGVTLIRSRAYIAGNTIGGNFRAGVSIDDSDNALLYLNNIGTVSGSPSLELGNRKSGVEIINGSLSSKLEANSLGYNGGDGITVVGSSTDGHEFAANNFRFNSGAPIDLQGTLLDDPNDPNDSDPGPNDLMNHPIIGTLTKSGTQWTVPFAFDVDVAGTYRFEFYKFNSATLSHTFLKSITKTNVTVGVNDYVSSITLTDGTEFSLGNSLSVLAIRVGGTGSGNTSELSLSTYPIGVTDTTPPKVIDVIIKNSSPTSAHKPFSFAKALASGTHEFKTVPVGGADTIQVRFSEDVAVFAGDLLMVGGYTGNLYGDYVGGLGQPVWQVAEFSYNPITFVASWRFDDPSDGDLLPNALPADTFGFYLNHMLQGDHRIYDAAFNELDGEWAYPESLSDPSPTFLQSGNNVAGGEFIFSFVNLPGDHNRDNYVEGAGFLEWQRMYAPTAWDRTFEQGDFDGDGDVDGADLDLWEENFGLDLSSF